jgi:hypothetical protein
MGCQWHLRPVVVKGREGSQACCSVDQRLLFTHRFLHHQNFRHNRSWPDLPSKLNLVTPSAHHARVLASPFVGNSTIIIYY